MYTELCVLAHSFKDDGCTFISRLHTHTHIQLQTCLLIFFFGTTTLLSEWRQLTHAYIPTCMQALLISHWNAWSVVIQTLHRKTVLVWMFPLSIFDFYSYMGMLFPIIGKRLNRCYLKIQISLYMIKWKKTESVLQSERVTPELSDVCVCEKHCVKWNATSED